jgi:hypothetical protein
LSEVVNRLLVADRRGSLNREFQFIHQWKKTRWGENLISEISLQVLEPRLKHTFQETIPLLTQRYWALAARLDILNEESS